MGSPREPWAYLGDNYDPEREAEVICGVCGAPVNAKASLEAAESALREERQRQSALEAAKLDAESALTEALDAMEKHRRLSPTEAEAWEINKFLWGVAARIRSQVEGSNDG